MALSWLLGPKKGPTDERKPKPEGWASKVISKLTITPERGKVTLWGQTRPQPSIEVLPERSAPRKPEHIVPTELQAPPPPRWRGLWGAPAVFILVAFAVVLVYTLTH